MPAISGGRAGGGARATRFWLDITFIDDGHIAALAGRFRSSPYPTDVLAFDYSSCPPIGGFAGDDVGGEIFVSLDAAGRQARERGVPLEHELLLLCIHGLLHLAGHGDESPAAWRRMKRAEFEAIVRAV